MHTRHHFILSGLILFFVLLLCPTCSGLEDEPTEEPTTPTEKPVIPAVSISPTGTIEIPASGGTAEIRIQVNTSYFIYTVSKVEWITTVIDKTKDYDCMVVTVQPNTTPEERSMKLSFWASKDGESKDAETSVLVHQAAGAEPHPNAVSVKTTVDLGGGDASGYDLHTLAGDFKLSGSEATVLALSDGNTPQLNMVTDKNGEVVLLSRDIYVSGGSLALSPRTTATALVTMHPAFAAIRGAEHYQRLVALAQGTAAFGRLEKEVEAAVKAGKSVLDESNTALMDAYDGALDALYDAIAAPTRVSDLYGLDGNEEPFKVEVSGKKVAISYKGLSPMYEGIIYDEDDEKVAELDIPAGGDLGVTDIFYPSQLFWRDHVDFDFTGLPEGTYEFAFDRGTKKAVIDLAVNLLCTGLDIVGATVSTIDTKTLTAAATQYFLSRDITLIQMMMSGTFSKSEIMEALYGAIADFVTSPFFTKLCTTASAASAQFYVKKLSKVVTIYCALRGSTNLQLRAMFCLSTPYKVNFSLKNQGTLALFVDGYAKPLLVFGNNQEGHSLEKLRIPITIKVDTGENKKPSPEFIVRFTVVEGGGWVEHPEKYTNQHLEAFTDWYLGQDSVDQVLEVDVLDPVSGGVINYLPLEVRAKATDLGNFSLAPVPEELQGKWKQFDYGENEQPILLNLRAQSADYENPQHPEKDFKGIQIGSVLRRQGDEEYYDLYFNEPDPSGKEPYEPFMKKVRIDAGFYNKMIVGTGYIGGKSEIYDWVEEKDLPEWLEGIWENIDGGNGAGQLYMLLGCNAEGEGYLSLRRYDDWEWQYLAVEERVYFFPTGSANGHESGDVRRVSDGAVLLSNCSWVEEYVWRADDILGLGPFTMESTIYDPF